MLNDAQNIKLLSKLRRAMEVFEPYIFTKVAQLPFVMYETAERLEKIPETSLFAPPAQRPSGFEWGGEGNYCWFLTQYTPPEELAADPEVRKRYLGKHFELRRSPTIDRLRQQGAEAQRSVSETDAEATHE